MHGRGAYMAGGCVWWGVRSKRGLCMVGGCVGRGTHGRGACVAGGGIHGRRGRAWQEGRGRACQILQDTVNERAVRILLECILVYKGIFVTVVF